MILLTERRTDRGLLVAACDADALGETYEDGEVSLTVNEEFYGGEEAEEEAVVEALARANVGNIVGTRVVELAVEAGVVEEANVLDVAGTRHAQFLRM
jgi:hypothetical protein